MLQSKKAKEYRDYYITTLKGDLIEHEKQLNEMINNIVAFYDNEIHFDSQVRSTIYHFLENVKSSKLHINKLLKS